MENKKDYRTFLSPLLVNDEDSYVHVSCRLNTLGNGSTYAINELKISDCVRSATLDFSIDSIDYLANTHNLSLIQLRNIRLHKVRNLRKALDEVENFIHREYGLMKLGEEE